MKNSCYNIGTKRKKQTKNVSNSQKQRGNANAQIVYSRKGSAKGRRDTAKKSMVKGGMKRYDSLQF